MKRMMTIGCLWLQVFARAQEALPGEMRNIPGIPVSLSYERTTSILFPYAIRLVDRGNGGIIAQQPRGAVNLLQLKAGQRNFRPTNCTVLTADGNLYAFEVRYADSVAENVFVVERREDEAMPAVQFDPPVYEQVLLREAAAVLVRPAFMQRKKTAGRMTMILKGIFVSGNAMWVRVAVQNRSAIRFDVNDLRLYVRDRKRARRKVVQERELVPLRASDLVVIGAGEFPEVALPFTPFTLSAGQELVMELTERGGGRMVVMRVPGRMILRAENLFR
jgi:conjugative transposon TraN protein